MPLEERPLTAFILSLLGGLFVVVGTGLGFVLYSSSPYGYVSELTGILVGVSIAFGILMLTMTMLLYRRPELHVAWGVTILVLHPPASRAYSPVTADWGWVSSAWCSGSSVGRWRSRGVPEWGSSGWALTRERTACA